MSEEVMNRVAPGIQTHSGYVLSRFSHNDNICKRRKGNVVAASRFSLIARRIGAAMAAGSLVAGGVFALEGSAAAATVHRCPQNSFCLYPDANFAGVFYEFPAGSYSQCRFDQLGHGLDNTASSMVNNTGRYLTLYRNLGCGGDTYVAKPHSEDSTFGNNTVVGGNFNDRASGIAFH